MKTLSFEKISEIYQPFLELCGEYEALPQKCKFPPEGSFIFGNQIFDNLTLPNDTELPTIIILPDETIESEEPLFEAVKIRNDIVIAKAKISLEQLKTLISIQQKMHGYKKVSPAVQYNSEHRTYVLEHGISEIKSFDFTAWLER